MKGYFWPFRLLIAVIFALAMLTIIISVINYFHEMQLRASQERFINGFKNALAAFTSNAQYGKAKEQNLVLPPGLYAAGTFAEIYKFPSDCIEFQAPRGTIVELSSDKKSVKLNKEFVVDVYYQCMLTNSGDCEIKCYISFGKEPDVD